MSSPFSPKNASSSEEREHPRLPLKPLHKISLQFEKNGTYYKIANISVGGLGFFSENISSTSEKAEQSVNKVQVKIETQTYEVDLKVVHKGDKIIGCSFVAPDSKLTKAIENYFTTELAALKLNRVETQNEEDVQGKMIFFRGQNNCEILIHENKGVLQHFSIILFGNYIEGDGKGAIWAGQRIDRAVVKAPSGVQLFKSVPQADQHFIESTIRFIDSTTGLTASQKENIITLLAQSRVHLNNTITEDA